MAMRIFGILLTANMVLASGCGSDIGASLPTLFAVPLSINGQPVGDAIVDTGGGFELLLREDFGLPMAGTVEVVVFGGPEHVNVAGPVDFIAGGIASTAKSALVAVSVCDCNGVGINFFRKESVTLTLDFSTPTVVFSDGSIAVGKSIPFEIPPQHLSSLATAFIQVDVKIGSRVKRVLALVDTGSTATLLQRSVLDDDEVSFGDTVRVKLSHADLGELETTVGLFVNPSLPDMIIGTDIMGDWGNRWHFTFTPADGIAPPSGVIHVER